LGSAMSKLDLHVHTCFSDGLDDPVTMVRAAARKGLSAVAIADHDTVEGWRHLRRSLDPKSLGVVVVPAIEVSTMDGHILCLGVEEEPPEKISRDAVEVADWARSVGGVPVFAHPFGGFFRGSRRVEAIAKRVTAIEVLNGRTTPRGNRMAMELAARLSKPITVGSDAHRAKEVGIVYAITESTIETPDQVLDAVERGLLRIGSPVPSLTAVIRNILGKYIEQTLRAVRRRSRAST